MTSRRFLLLLLLVASPAEAQVCGGASATVASDGRALGHLPYGDVAPGDLVTAPPGVAIRGTCRLRPEAMAALQRLLAAAAGDPKVEGQLYALSCHRSIESQEATFCKPRAEATDGDRSISVAPPGHSEHGTGYALDFTVRPADGCRDAEACMAAKPAFRWLRENAPRFGFELSAHEPGAARARFIFARARREFPADPAIVDPPPPPPVVSAPPPPPPPAAPVESKKGRKKRQAKE
ncbi:MAG: D-alanyl-D-alanine carboxypeptidase family protein [Sphingomonas sp.]|uniref:D-alanyl-D-alanine carboxypeptidase family protein n=1 Tax=Sphingomonas sp. TaxID=28214 RepID=UPI001AC9CA54|nr:D-alanyl-D-alanine carboxypeptidase family protein [Sphingomonas sp.]MBN8849519.1 D-alanyl-D-alanine carboxypeptidase family protein [Sphingomonas sp.]